MAPHLMILAIGCTKRIESTNAGQRAGELDQQVGPGRWVINVTADHGAVPDPKVSGAFQISTGAMAAQLKATFDDTDSRPLLEGLLQTQIFVNMAELRQNGFTLEDMSQFIMTLTEEQTAGEGMRVPPSKQNDRVFQAAFPSSLMAKLPCLPEATAEERPPFRHWPSC